MVDTARGVILGLKPAERSFLAGVLYSRSRMELAPTPTMRSGFEARWTVWLEGKPAHHPKALRGIFGKPAVKYRAGHEAGRSVPVFVYTMTDRPTIALLVETMFDSFPLSMLGMASALRDFCRTNDVGIRTDAVAKFRSIEREAARVAV